MKIKLFLILLSAFALMSVKSVAAQVNDTEVVNSGDNVEIKTEVNKKTNVEVKNENTANIDQQVFAVANTGGNVASKNIGSGVTINTGDAKVDTKMQVEANTNKTVIDVGQDNKDDCAGNKTDVVNTGDNLKVNTHLKTENKVDVKNENYADVQQKVVAVANTGLNFAKGNIAGSVSDCNDCDHFQDEGGGIAIETGNAEIKTNLGVKVNENITKVDVGNKGEDGNETCVTNTGDDVFINTNVDRKTDVKVENSNQAFIEQDVFAIANTGLNFVEGNISDHQGDLCNDCESGCDCGDCDRCKGDGGEVAIKTGDAKIDTKMEIEANKNLTWIDLGKNKDDYFRDDDKDGKCDRCGHPKDECTCQKDDCCNGNVTDVVNTGDCLRVDTNVRDEEKINVKNNNEVCAKQHLFDLANTGINFANKNIGESKLHTGCAETKADLRLLANKNFTSLGGYMSDNLDKYFNDLYF